MSYDSIQMLTEARSSVHGGIFPAMPVYILRFFDFFGNGPALMVLAQVSILLTSIVFLLYKMRFRFLNVSISLLFLISIPTVLGCMLVLWKDVTLGALMMVTLLVIFSGSINYSDNEIKYRFFKYIALFVLIIATLLKFNAISSSLVLAIYWIFVFKNKCTMPKKLGWLVAIMMLMIFSNAVVNSYSFPSFKKLAPNNIFYGLLANDLLGISKWSGESLLPIGSQSLPNDLKYPIEEINKIYSSLGSAVMHDNIIRSDSEIRLYSKEVSHKNIVDAWLAAVKKHPGAYLRYRLDLFSEIIGATGHATYEPTHYNRIDENNFGITFEERKLTSIIVNYIYESSKKFFGKPWFVLMLSVLSCISIYVSKAIEAHYRRLAYYSFAIAFANLLPYFFITLSGEVRYAFIALVFSSIPIFVALFSRSSIKKLI